VKGHLVAFRKGKFMFVTASSVAGGASLAIPCIVACARPGDRMTKPTDDQPNEERRSGDERRKAERRVVDIPPKVYGRDERRERKERRSGKERRRKSTDDEADENSVTE
jgi:hypothetical protein